MYRKIIRNDIKRSKLITVTITAFILAAALLTSLAATLMWNLSAGIDAMMEKGATPHFMQMHSGDIDINKLQSFADQQNVEDFQVLGFLNIEGNEIQIGEHSLSDSVQDNGLSAQSGSFDFLLDLNGEIVYPTDGEIYLPVYYMKEVGAEVGDTVTIHGNRFTVAGFVRDSQMNSALVSSKRFLVSDNDFEKLRDFGKLEYLIEFRLQDSSHIAAFESAYIDADLPATGPPAITYSLFKLVNGISDGIMIAVLVLISMLVILVTFLSIRFTLLAKIEEDYKEIGVLKAVGFRVSHIKKLYLAKYGAMALIACVLGFLLSLFAKEPLLENIRLYMGEGGNSFVGLLLGICGAAIIFLVIILYVNRVLGRFRKISPAEAIRFGAPQDKSKGARRFQLNKNRIFSTNIFLALKDILSRKKLYVTMLLVLIISAFILIVPQNIYNTISDRSFMTYMGIGNCDMRIDVQQTDNIAGKMQEIAGTVAQDSGIERYTVLTSYMFDMAVEDGSTQRLKVELGDHEVFPIEYSSGRAPKVATEIAISTINADDLEKTVGDTIILVIDGEERELTVCGLYSDITNGGKTAKAVFETEGAEVLWSIIPVALYNRDLINTKVSEYKTNFSFAKVSNIDDYIDQTFGTTIAAIKMASYAAIGVTVLLTVLVTLLFTKMLITKDRYPIAILKSLGFKSNGIGWQYIIRSLIILIVGVITGTILANTLGEVVGGALISSFGASTFNFKINPLFTYLFAPALIALCVYIATLFGVSDIKLLAVSEHIKE